MHKWFEDHTEGTGHLSKSGHRGAKTMRVVLLLALESVGGCN